MPIELCLDVLKAFQKQYRNKEFTADLAVSITNALIPICNDIENGKYDLKGAE